MSVAQAILDKYGFEIIADGETLNFDCGEFDIDYQPITIIEGYNYFNYLVDNYGVFDNKFDTTVVLGIEELQTLGYALISLDISQANPKVFPNLPWFPGQKKIYKLIRLEEGIPVYCNEYEVVPKEVTIKQMIIKQQIMLAGSSVSQTKFEKYEVGDDI